METPAQVMPVALPTPQDPMTALGAGCPCKRKRLLMDIAAQQQMQAAQQYGQMQ